jgi:hypothetical protein
MTINNETIPLCLIGGTGRSGTTILKSIFSSHPDCTRLKEYRFSFDPDGLTDFYLGFQNCWTPYQFDLMVKRLRKLLISIGRNNTLLKSLVYFTQNSGIDRFFPFNLVPAYSGIGFSKYCPNYYNLVDELVNDLTDFSYKGLWNGTSIGHYSEMFYSYPNSSNDIASKLGHFWSSVIEDVCRAQNSSFFVEDNTWNILKFDSILKLMPHAKLVHVVRDPRDVVASYMKMRWSPNDLIKASEWYKGIMSVWLAKKSNLPNDSFIDIKLHNLVSDPREVLERITNFWNMPWSDDLMKENLSKSNTGRWRKDFDTKQQKILNDSLCDYINVLGYE